MKNKITKSDSILQKRLRRFKSIKRGYYSFIILVILYMLSFLAPIIVNSKAILVCYSNNEYDDKENVNMTVFELSNICSSVVRFYKIFIL